MSSQSIKHVQHSLSPLSNDREPQEPEPHWSPKWWRNRISITPLGLLTLGSSYLIYIYLSQQERDLILEMMCILLMSIVAFIVVLAYFERWRLGRALQRLNQSHEQLEVEVGQELLTGFSIPSINLNPLFQLKVKLVSPKTSNYQLELYQRELHEIISLSRRGRVKQVMREFKMEDLFGVSELTWYDEQPYDLRALPQTSQLSMATIEQLQEGEDIYDPVSQSQGDLVELRRYTDGDPLKWILWRVYARSRELVVRSPERALSPRTDLIVYYLADPTDEPSASTARAYLESGLFGDDYQMFADGCRGAARDRSEAIEHLIVSAQGEPLSALDELLELDARQLRGVLVFASALTPFDRLRQVADSLPTPPLFILSLYLDLERKTVKRSWFSRLFKSAPLHSLHLTSTQDLKQVQTTYQQLSAERSPLLIAQPEGQVLSVDLIEQLGEHLIEIER